MDNTGEVRERQYMNYQAELGKETKGHPFPINIRTTKCCHNCGNGDYQDTEFVVCDKFNLVSMPWYVCEMWHLKSEVEEPDVESMREAYERLG